MEEINGLRNQHRKGSFERVADKFSEDEGRVKESVARRINKKYETNRDNAGLKIHNLSSVIKGVVGPNLGVDKSLSDIANKTETKKKRKKIVNEYHRKRNLKAAEQAYRRGGN